MILFALDKDSPVPFYRQIVDMVLAGISAGHVAPGDKLPTIRGLAVGMEVNPNTVVRAYSELRILGVLDTQQGSGVFVKAQRDDRVSSAERKRATAGLCRDFVGRAQLLNINISELVEYLTRMQGESSPGSSEDQRGERSVWTH